MCHRSSRRQGLAEASLYPYLPDYTNSETALINSAPSEFSGFFLNTLPGILDVTQGSMCLADTEAQSEAIIQPRMGEE
jgi:hypothetical protein